MRLGVAQLHLDSVIKNRPNTHSTNKENKMRESDRKGNLRVNNKAFLLLSILIPFQSIVQCLPKYSPPLEVFHILLCYKLEYDNKTVIFWMHKYSPPNQFFVDLPLTGSLLAYVSTSFAHVETEISPYFLQNKSSSIKLDGHHLWTPIFKSSGLDLDVAFDWPFKQINMLWSNLRHCCSGCMFRIIVLLEGEPLPQSQVHCRL